MIDLINRLASVPAVSGRERAICEIIENELSSSCETFYLPSGDLIVKKNGRSKDAKKLMIATNVDVRGFFVTFAESDGKFRLALSDSEFSFAKHIGKTLISSDGTKTRLISEKDTEPKFSDIYIKIEEGSNGTLNPGDFLSPETVITEDNGQLIGLNVASRALICAMINSAKSILPDYDIYFAFNSCGLPGGRGAKSAAYAIKPDASISLRTISSDKTTPIILARDGLSLSSLDLFDKAIACAKYAAIDFSLSATASGTRDAWSISTSNTGIPTVSLALPCTDSDEYSESISKDTVFEFSRIITVLGKNILN